jgi:hypothetical protein
MSVACISTKGNAVEEGRWVDADDVAEGTEVAQHRERRPFNLPGLLPGHSRIVSTTTPRRRNGAMLNFRRRRHTAQNERPILTAIAASLAVPSSASSRFVQNRDSGCPGG